MEEVFDQIETLGKTEKRVAMATLVATRGTAPKKEGAKMWVGEGGRILGSVTIGGCVDARVIEDSEEALSDSESRLLSLALGEEDAWEGGFTCAGTIQVLIEPFNLNDPESELVRLYRAIDAEVKEGRFTVLATRLDDPGSKVLVFEDGESSGSLGDSSLDVQARSTASDLIRKRASRTVALGAAGSVDVFFEVHGPPATLVIFGAGHVSMLLVGLAKELGFRTVVVDGRPRFATRERFPAADELLIGIPSEIAQTMKYNSSTFVVLAAHDYKYDIPVLRKVLRTEAAYIGMLGSKRRGESILEFLKESGIPTESLERVRVPVGLDIGAQTAAEIALSILAEAVAVKSGRSGEPMSARDKTQRSLTTL